MNKITSLFFIVLLASSFIAMPAAHAKTNPVKAAQLAKEQLALIPLSDISGDIQDMKSQIESAVVNALEPKYRVFHGDKVVQELRDAAKKETEKANKEHRGCTEIMCLQRASSRLGIEIFAVVHVTKKEGGYLLSISIQNVQTTESIFDQAISCKGCNAFDILDKLKELVATHVGASVAAATPAPAEPEAPAVKASSSENDLWEEVKKADTADYYTAYLKDYPKGKYAVLAKSKLNGFKEAAAAEQTQQEKDAWETVKQSDTTEGYQSYLSAYPKGRYASLAAIGITKLKKEATQQAAEERAAEAKQKRVAAQTSKTEKAQEEKQAWETAQSSDSLESYDEYLNAYPKGKYSAAATAAKNKLKREQAAEETKQKFAKPQPVQKERLVLMPLRLGEEDQKLTGAMETALVEGLKQKYEVISGEQIAKKAREIFMKESRNTSHKEFDETRGLQDIAESFQSELIAVANITKRDDGYYLALSIQNVFDNKNVYSKFLPCQWCDSFQVVEKLKELAVQ